MIKVAFATTGEEELGVMRSTLERGYYGLAEKVLEFEKNIEAFIGVRHIVAVNTGTSALHLALDILGIGPGDEVIVPSLTYVASFQAISSDLAISLKTGEVKASKNCYRDWTVNLIDTGLNSMTGGRLHRLKDRRQRMNFAVNSLTPARTD